MGNCARRARHVRIAFRPVRHVQRRSPLPVLDDQAGSGPGERGEGRIVRVAGGASGSGIRTGRFRDRGRRQGRSTQRFAISRNGHRSAFDDPRNALVWEFVLLVAKLDARSFVLENVKEPPIGRHRNFLEELIGAIGEFGYRIRVSWRNAPLRRAPASRTAVFDRREARCGAPRVRARRRGRLGRRDLRGGGIGRFEAHLSAHA